MPAVNPMSNPLNPATLQDQVGQEVVNPMDGKTYVVQQADPGQGATLVDPMTQQQNHVPEEEIQGLQPVIKTTASKYKVGETVPASSRLGHEGPGKIVGVHEELLGFGSDESETIYLVAFDTDVREDEVDEYTEWELDSIMGSEVPSVRDLNNRNQLRHLEGDPDKVFAADMGQIREHLTEDMGSYRDQNSLLRDLIEDETEESLLFEELAKDERSEVDMLEDMIRHNEGEIEDDRELKHELKESNMRHPWQAARDQMRKEAEERKEASRKPTPIEKESRQEQFFRANPGMVRTAKVDDTGHEQLGIPVGETKEISIGLTEFPLGTKKTDTDPGPGYGKMTMKEMDEKQVEEREHFRNQELLPVHRMKREELAEYGLGKDPKGVNHGPTRESSEDLAIARAIGLSVEAAEEDDLKNVDVEQTGPNEVTVKPIQYKPDLKKAPGEKTYKEPSVIDPAKSQAKEAITKLQNTRKKIDATMKSMEAAVGPILQTLQRTQQPFQVELAAQDKLLKSYVEMVYSALQALESNVVAYEDMIVAAHETEDLETKRATTAQIVQLAKQYGGEIEETVNKLIAEIENENTVTVLKRFLYQYPISETQEKKISSAEVQSPVESDGGDVESVMAQLKQWLMEAAQVLSSSIQAFVNATS